MGADVTPGRPEPVAAATLEREVATLPDGRRLTLYARRPPAGSPARPPSP